jgi:murein DD-endopeptidase MepM/ murein hydrolase activator NlpD
MGSYQPATSSGPEITGSVQAPPSVAPNPGNNSQWSWDGGTAVTVAPGESVDVIAHRYGVPTSAILQANNLGAGQAIYPGQRLVIPRYNNHAAAPAAAGPSTRPAAIAPARPVPQAVGALSNTSAPGGVHIVAPGETLTRISRIYNKSLTDIARANNIQPHTKLNIGDKIVIPGVRMSSAQKGAPKLAQAKPLANPATKTPAVKQAAAPAEPTQSASVVTPAAETPSAATNSVKSAEGAPPSFRWPVKARVIAGFGPKANGQQNDGINLAVPEGTAVKAAEDGVVAYAGSELKGYGNLVLIRHSNGYVTAYAHAKELMVKRGDTIKRGQVIAKSGQTGNVDAPQLHFEIRKGPAPMDPMPMLSGG